MKKIARILALFSLIATLLAHQCLFAELSLDQVNQINKIFGINFLQDKNLWDDTPESFVKRLGAKFEETEMGNLKVYTTYAKGKILNASIEQLRFSASNGKLSQIEMVFFNKGDSVEGKRWTSQMQREMKQQWDAIKDSLDKFAGKSQKGTWGEGRMKNKAQIWNFDDIVFSLEFKPREFIILHISQKGQRRADVSIAASNSEEFDGSANVKKNSNGDVFIDNIPMVDQGPKGYCVPATLERCFKYYNIAGVDMHKIAAVCNTQMGGGTTINNVMNDFKKVCNTYKLRMTPVGSLSLYSIARFVDKGTPICWTMFSTDDYMKRMLENSAMRKSENFQDYCKKIDDQKKLKKKPEGAHICLIIGYNKKSNEIAVSNPWGERFQITWVRFDDAKVVSRNAFVINPR